MALQTFDQQFYLNNNPDVLTAILNGVFTSAEQHYMLFGEREGRMPSAFFDPFGYFAQNPDVVAAVTAGTFSTALEHFEMHGAGENRTPGNIQFSEEYYLAQNSDVKAAVDAGTFTSGYQHFVLFGAEEGRAPAAGVQPGTPGSSFSLTNAVGEQIIGTANDDTITGVLGATSGSNDSTLNIGDVVDGAGGRDTFGLIIDPGTNLPAGATIRNVEIVNLDIRGGSPDATLLTSGAYQGVEQLWQVDNQAGAGTFQNVSVATGVTAGFRSTGVAATAQTVANTVATATAADKSVAAAVDGVATGSAVSFAGTGPSSQLETATISGSVTTIANANVLNVNADANVETLNAGISSNTTLNVAGVNVETLDASKSGGDLTLDVTGLASIDNVIGGSGRDTLSVDVENGNDEFSVNMGAGNDTVILQGTGGGSDDKASIALGAGRDTIQAQTVQNIQAAAPSNTNLLDNIITVSDFSTSEDVLDLQGAGAKLTAAQLDSANTATNLFTALTGVAGIIGANSSAVFSYGGDAYVFVNDGAAAVSAGDGLVKLTGVDATLFTDAQNGNLIL